MAYLHPQSHLTWSSLCRYLSVFSLIDSSSPLISEKSPLCSKTFRPLPRLLPTCPGNRRPYTPALSLTSTKLYSLPCKVAGIIQPTPFCSRTAPFFIAGTAAVLAGRENNAIKRGRPVRTCRFLFPALSTKRKTHGRGDAAGNAGTRP